MSYLHLRAQDGFSVVNTCNFDGDYPMEVFECLPYRTKAGAEVIADRLNAKAGGTYATRYYKVVELPYKLNRSDPND